MNKKTMPEPSKPGKLAHQVTVELHTEPASILWLGDWKKTNFGLRQYAELMKQIMIAKNKDDPYADWMCTRVKFFHRTVEQKLAHDTALLKSVIQQQEARGIYLKLMKSDNPVQVPLKFATPFGYHAAYLLADFDELVRLTLAIEHAHILIEDDPLAIRRKAKKALRQLFSLPMQWKLTGVTIVSLPHDRFYPSMDKIESPTRQPSGRDRPAFDTLSLNAKGYVSSNDSTAA